MAVDMFLDFSAAPARGQLPLTVVGETQDRTYSKAIEVKSFDLAMENTTTIGSAATGAGSGKVQFKPFKVTHQVDSASATLFQALSMGEHFQTVKFYVRRSGTGNPFVTYTFSLVFVTSIETVMDATTSDPVETIQMEYGAVQMSYQPGATTGQPSGQPVVGTWNQVTNQPNLTIPNN